MSEPELPARWRELALSPPRAMAGADSCSGLLRSLPEDFQVHELLGFAPDGEGSHVLLQVRKRQANTDWVARQLARLARVRPHDVGYAGLKDRQAVATQWFTVPRGPKPAPVESWLEVAGEGFEVIAAHAHRRKLPRGALSGNRFELMLRDVQGDPAAALRRLDLLAAQGAPNYFGPQRFGRDLGNLRELPRAGRGFAISAARSLIFNAVLAERVTDGSWAQLRSGDCANLDGRGSFFIVQDDGADSAAALQARVAELDVHPSGPMWGSGAPESRGEVLELEQRAAAQFPELCAALEALGLAQERRALRVALREASGSIDADARVLRIGFTLRSGAFATTVLRELGDFRSAQHGDQAGDQESPDG